MFGFGDIKGFRIVEKHPEKDPFGLPGVLGTLVEQSQPIGGVVTRKIPGKGGKYPEKAGFILDRIEDQVDCPGHYDLLVRRIETTQGLSHENRSGDGIRFSPVAEKDSGRVADP
jgi:hypothetical protein